MDNKSESHKLFPKFKYIRNIISLILIGIVAAVLLVRISTIENTLSVLRTMSFSLVWFAVLAQTLSYLSSGYLIQMIAYGKQKIYGVFKGTLIYIAGESVSLAGGMASSMAATYYWVWSENENPSEGVLSGILPFLYNSAALITVSIIGMIVLLFNHNLTLNQGIFYSIILIVLATGLLFIIYIFLHREKLEELLAYIEKKLLKLRNRRYDFTSIKNGLANFYNGIKILDNGGWIRYGTGPAFNIIFDMLTIYIFFLAAGFQIKLSVLVAGYGLAFLFGRSTFFIPGGSGVIEAGMVAIYTSLGVPNHISVVAVLGYRFLSFWLPSILGFIAILYLKKIGK
ncbi:MAG: lysylphosphatidylglycerol synthase transmembrane domain-containing protein [Solirubrobacterales bacterium]